MRRFELPLFRIYLSICETSIKDLTVFGLIITSLIKNLLKIVNFKNYTVLKIVLPSNDFQLAFICLKITIEPIEQ